MLFKEVFPLTHRSGLQQHREIKRTLESKKSAWHGTSWWSWGRLLHTIVQKVREKPREVGLPHMKQSPCKRMYCILRGVTGLH